MNKLNKTLAKNIFFIIWYVIYLRQGYFLYTNEGWDNSAITGMFMIIYPLTLCHLESLRTTGEVVWFKGYFDDFSDPQKFFVLIIGLISMTAFWLMTFLSVFSILVSIF